MVASTFRAANLAIHARVLKSFGGVGAEQQKVDAKAAVAFPAITHVVPVRVHRSIRMTFADGIYPTLFEEPAEGGSACWLHECVPCPRFRRIDISTSRNHIVVAREYNRHIGSVEGCGMKGEALQPSELVVEFRSRLWISVRCI